MDAELHQQLARSLQISDSHLISQLAEVSNNELEAQDYLGQGGRSEWKEVFSEERQRLYYAEQGTERTSWDPPAQFRFADWQLDSATYGINISTAKRLFEAAHWLQAETKDGAWRKPAALLIKILANVVDCSNSQAKFRQLQLCNEKFRNCVWNILAAQQILLAAGFQESQGVVSIGADADISPLTAAVARLRRIAANQGHSGAAEFFPASAHNSASGTDPARSPFLGTPGFRYQQRIYHCSECNHPINDGSEKLWTGAHDAPRGEFRYECMSCAAHNLCEGCWDRLSSGDLQHAADHNWHHHHPRMTRHNTAHGSEPSASNPWGVRTAGGSAGRALQRMYERHGIRTHR